MTSVLGISKLIDSYEVHLRLSTGEVVSTQSVHWTNLIDRASWHWPQWAGLSVPQIWALFEISPGSSVRAVCEGPLVPTSPTRPIGAMLRSSAIQWYRGEGAALASSEFEQELPSRYQGKMD